MKEKKTERRSHLEPKINKSRSSKKVNDDVLINIGLMEYDGKEPTRVFGKPFLIMEKRNSRSDFILSQFSSGWIPNIACILIGWCSYRNFTLFDSSPESFSSDHNQKGNIQAKGSYVLSKLVANFLFLKFEIWSATLITMMKVSFTNRKNWNCCWQRTWNTQMRRQSLKLCGGQYSRFFLSQPPQVL